MSFIFVLLQGNMLDLPQDEDTPEKRVNKIFSQMDTVSLLTFHLGDKDAATVKCHNVYKRPVVFDTGFKQTEWAIFLHVILTLK